MNLWLILPIKPFAEGKSRLADVLPQPSRAQLSRQLFQHVLEQAIAASVLSGIIVVSRDAGVLDGFAAPKLHYLRETAYDLNQALTQGREAALQHGAEALLILPADLPHLTTADITNLYETTVTLQRRTSGVVIVPSADNGTNALLLYPPTAINFAFGRNSFTHHCQAAQLAEISVTVHAAPHLTLDVDNPVDLAYLAPELRRTLRTEINPL